MSPRTATNEFSRRVLLIEHDAGDRRTLRNWLVADQCQVHEATDLISALSACQNFRPDLILLELRLPGRDGFEVIRQIKKDPAMHAIPVIFLSTGATATERVRGLDLGAVDFVSRPFDPTELQARVRVALRTRYLQDLLEQRAHIDGLTGLANRHALHDRLSQAWDDSKRSGEPLSLIFADLDHFKQINDRHGHAAGDEVLRRASSLLRRTVRTADFVARYGGEEFVVIAPRCGIEGAMDMAERFRAVVAEMAVPIHDAVIPVTSSVGIAAATVGPGLEPKELLRQADEALYAAKLGGRNAVWRWDADQNKPVAARPPRPETTAAATLAPTQEVSA